MSQTVTVSAAVLQDLLFNVGLASIGQGGMETTVSKQAAALQACIDEQVGDANMVYGRELPPADGIELAFIEHDDVKVVSIFGVR